MSAAWSNGAVHASLQGSGPVVVMLHGQPGGARDFDRVLPLLGGLSVLVPDRPGYDGTPAEGFLGNARAVVTCSTSTASSGP